MIFVFRRETWHLIVGLTSNCLALNRDLFNTYPDDLNRLYSAASAANHEHDASIDLGRNGTVALELRVIDKGYPFEIRPTKQIRFQRVSVDNFKLNVLNRGDVPVLTFQDPDLNADWSGPLRSIDFIDSDPVFEFGKLNCVWFKKFGQ